MKCLLLLSALALAQAAQDGEIHVRMHVVKDNAICYKWCPKGQYCALGESTCRGPENGQCFNPATSKWIAKCDPGFVCRDGKCDYAKKAHKKELIKGPNDICYKACPSGQYCAIGQTSCRPPKGDECFNPATSKWIAKCDPGFVCRKGKCDYAKKEHKKDSGNDAICYKWCPKGQYCARGETSCHGPEGGKCFNPATSRWIDKCDPGFVCRNGKCDYAKSAHKKELVKGPNDICYASCAEGEYCAIGETSCRPPEDDECFNPATSEWIDKCDPGFVCRKGKCDYAKKALKKASGNDAICYKWCPSGQYCARGDNRCLSRPGRKCFNPATARWIDKCDPGFACKNGKCDYAKHLGKKELIKGPNDICYKSCPAGQYCARGETDCHAPEGSKCFNPATSKWIDKCDQGFACHQGKCDYATAADKSASKDDDSDDDSDSDSDNDKTSKPPSDSDAICYKSCPAGQYCARGETNCHAPEGSKCFNPATSRWIDKCDSGFVCRNGKCDYAKKAAEKVIVIDLE